MDTRHNSFYAPRLILGLGIILVGVLFLLGNLDIINSDNYVRYWPSLLILIGIAYLLQSRQGSGFIWGIILIFIGSAMMLERLYFLHFDIWAYWPLLIVFVGIKMILKASSKKSIDISTSKTTETADPNSYLKTIAVMGGFKRSNNSQDFKGGELTAVMGGLEIDLREASIKEEAVIDIFILMGGVALRVPEDWLIVIEGFPFMGGFDDKTRPPKEASKRLVIKGTAMMGGVEIKN